MAKQIYQIQIAIQKSNPKIWRRVLVNSDIVLNELHEIIQTAMGWSNAHLHQFIKDKIEYSRREFELDGTIDSKKIKLNTLLKKEKDEIKYEYDFGDGCTILFLKRFCLLMRKQLFQAA